MTKELFKGSILFGPVPAVLVTTIDRAGKVNVFTVGWTGVACSHPPLVTIAVRKERLSHENISATGEFVINLTTREMVKMTDFCGCRSGRTVDKIKHFGMELEPGIDIAVPSLKKSPVALECKVRSVTELGSHDLFVAEIVGIRWKNHLLTRTAQFSWVRRACWPIVMENIFPFPGSLLALSAIPSPGNLCVRRGTGRDSSRKK